MSRVSTSCGPATAQPWPSCSWPSSSPSPCCRHGSSIGGRIINEKGINKTGPPLLDGGGRPPRRPPCHLALHAGSAGLDAQPLGEASGRDFHRPFRAPAKPLEFRQLRPRP